MEKQKTRVLIIDDEEVFSSFIKTNLENTGDYDVLTAANGSDGISIAKKEHPDIIFLDIMMPELSGPEVSRQLLDSKSTADIPIVFLTAIVHKDEIESDEGVISGRNILAKPVTTEELVTTIKKLVKREV